MSGDRGPNLIARLLRISRTGGPQTDTESPVISNETDPSGGTWSIGVPVVLTFDVSDNLTPASSLVVTATSSNQSILTNANIVPGGSGTARTLTITTTGAGFVVITLKVTDLSGNYSESLAFQGTSS
jgi:hypothetical protein